MKPYYIFKVFDSEKLNIVKKQLSIATWVDGSNSYTQGENLNKKISELKNNFEILSETAQFENIFEIVGKSLYDVIGKDPEYFLYTMAKIPGGMIVSRMEKGGFFNVHTDDPSNGEFSTTIFLNSPDEYEGGELELFYNGSSEKIKLDAGWAVTYPTGTYHRVCEVTSGKRYVVVQWIKSKFKDTDIRTLASNLYSILLESSTDLYSIQEPLSVEVVARTSLNILERKFGDLYTPSVL